MSLKDEKETRWNYRVLPGCMRLHSRIINWLIWHFQFRGQICCIDLYYCHILPRSNWHSNVYNFFLNGILIEVVYMTQPHGLVNSQFPQCVHDLTKALYVLMQACSCYQWLNEFLITLGFVSSKFLCFFEAKVSYFYLFMLIFLSWKAIVMNLRLSYDNFCYLIT